MMAQDKSDQSTTMAKNINNLKSTLWTINTTYPVKVFNVEPVVYFYAFFSLTVIQPSI